MLVSGCTGASPNGLAEPLPTTDTAASGTAPARPAVPTGGLAEQTLEVLARRFWIEGVPAEGDLAALAATSDVRLAWPIIDLLRFEEGGPIGDEAIRALEALTGVPPESPAWKGYADLLLRWDIPAPPDYRRYKWAQHRIFDQRWDPFFEDADADLDWRVVTWGGVPYDGIPALDDPELLAPTEATWLRPDDVVFGVEVDGEHRAYPRRILDVHELVNDTLGGRRIALPHCTLCGVAVAYVTDAVAGGDPDDLPLTFATSGLLQRSNKLMFDRETESLWDQFRGTALGGPLQGSRLTSIPLVVTTWDEWRAAHPDTTTLAKPSEIDRNLGDPYDGTLLDDRPDEPIFPTGVRDGRLAPHERVLGVQLADGSSVAFVVAEVRAVAGAGGRAVLGDVEVGLGADGGLVVLAPRAPAEVRESFWFAWSQFHPGTELWRAPDD